MKRWIFWFVFVVMASCARADEFSRSGKFESVEAFVAAAKSFEPTKIKGEMAALFTVKQLGQQEDPKTGTSVSAKTIESCDVLWAGQDYALVFATAAPPTEATRSVVGVLFLLKQTAAQWLVADFLRFTAIGKYARISAELTAGTGSGYSLGCDGMMPVVTIKEDQGGRGHYYQLSASYTFAESRLKRLDLE